MSVAGGVGGLSLRIGVAGWAGALVALPVLALVAKGLSGGPTAFFAAVTEPAAVDALLLSAWTGLIAAVVNASTSSDSKYVLTTGGDPSVIRPSG